MNRTLKAQEEKDTRNLLLLVIMSKLCQRLTDVHLYSSRPARPVQIIEDNILAHSIDKCKWLNKTATMRETINGVCSMERPA